MLCVVVRLGDGGSIESVGLNEVSTSIQVFLRNHNKRRKLTSTYCGSEREVGTDGQCKQAT